MGEDRLAEEVGEAVGTSPEMVRFYAARMAIEITIRRPTVKGEWMKIYAAVAKPGPPLHERGRVRAAKRRSTSAVEASKHGNKLCP